MLREFFRGLTEVPDLSPDQMEGVVRVFHRCLFVIEPPKQLLTQAFISDRLSVDGGMWRGK